MQLSLVQYGVQSAFDTPVAATGKLLGKIEVKQDTTVTIPKDDIGLNAPGFRTVKGGKLVTNTIEIARAYYRALPMIFSSLLTNDAVPVEDVGFTWHFSPDFTHLGNTRSLYTIENGDLGIQGFENANVQFEKIKISGTIPQDGKDAPITISIDYFGKDSVKAVFTANIELPSVVELSAYLTKLYIDSSWDVVGTTLKSGLLRAFDIEIVGGAYPETHGGRDTYDNIGEGTKSILINLTIDSGAESQDLMDHLGDTRAVKLEFPGPLIGVGVYHNLSIAANCAIMEVIPYKSQEKDTQLASVTLEGIVDIATEKVFEVDVVTDIGEL